MSISNLFVPNYYPIELNGINVLGDANVSGDINISGDTILNDASIHKLTITNTDYDSIITDGGIQLKNPNIGDSIYDVPNVKYINDRLAYGIAWKQPFLGFVDVSTISSPIVGDRYIQSIDSPPYIVNYVYEFKNNIWNPYQPQDGDAILDKVTNYSYVFTTDLDKWIQMMGDSKPQELNIYDSQQNLIYQIKPTGGEMFFSDKNSSIISNRFSQNLYIDSDADLTEDYKASFVTNGSAIINKSLIVNQILNAWNGEIYNLKVGDPAFALTITDITDDNTFDSVTDSMLSTSLATKTFIENNTSGLILNDNTLGGLTPSTTKAPSQSSVKYVCDQKAHLEYSSKSYILNIANAPSGTNDFNYIPKTTGHDNSTTYGCCFCSTLGTGNGLWIIPQNSANIFIYSYDNGQTWNRTPITINPNNTNNFVSLSFNRVSNKIWGVSVPSDAQGIYISSDGFSYDRKYDIADYIYGGFQHTVINRAMFHFAISSPRIIYTDNNGQTWSGITVFDGYSWGEPYDITFNTYHNLYLVLAPDGVHTTPDLINWTLNAVTWDSIPTRFLLYGEDFTRVWAFSNDRAYYSDNAITWNNSNCVMYDSPLSGYPSFALYLKHKDLMVTGTWITIVFGDGTTTFTKSSNFPSDVFCLGIDVNDVTNNDDVICGNRYDQNGFINEQAFRMTMSTAPIVTVGLTIEGDNFTNPISSIKLSTDPTLGQNSNNNYPSEYAVKNYVDTHTGFTPNYIQPIFITTSTDPQITITNGSFIGTIGETNQGGLHIGTNHTGQPVTINNKLVVNASISPEFRIQTNSTIYTDFMLNSGSIDIRPNGYIGDGRVNIISTSDQLKLTHPTNPYTATFAETVNGDISLISSNSSGKILSPNIYQFNTSDPLKYSQIYTNLSDGSLKLYNANSIVDLSGSSLKSGNITAGYGYFTNSSNQQLRLLYSPSVYTDLLLSSGGDLSITNNTNPSNIILNGKLRINTDNTPIIQIKNSSYTSNIQFDGSGNLLIYPHTGNSLILSSTGTQLKLNNALNTSSILTDSNGDLNLSTSTTNGKCIIQKNMRLLNSSFHSDFSTDNFGNLNVDISNLQMNVGGSLRVTKSDGNPQITLYNATGDTYNTILNDSTGNLSISSTATKNIQLNNKTVITTTDQPQLQLVNGSYTGSITQNNQGDVVISTSLSNGKLICDKVIKLSSTDQFKYTQLFTNASTGELDIYNPSGIVNFNTSYLKSGRLMPTDAINPQIRLKYSDSYYCDLQSDLAGTLNITPVSGLVKTTGRQEILSSGNHLTLTNGVNSTTINTDSSGNLNLTASTKTINLNNKTVVNNIQVQNIQHIALTAGQCYKIITSSGNYSDYAGTIFKSISNSGSITELSYNSGFVVFFPVMISSFDSPRIMILNTDKSLHIYSLNGGILQICNLNPLLTVTIQTETTPSIFTIYYDTQGKTPMTNTYQMINYSSVDASQSDGAIYIANGGLTTGKKIFVNDTSEADYPNGIASIYSLGGIICNKNSYFAGNLTLLKDTAQLKIQNTNSPNDWLTIGVGSGGMTSIVQNKLANPLNLNISIESQTDYPALYVRNSSGNLIHTIAHDGSGNMNFSNFDPSKSINFVGKVNLSEITTNSISDTYGTDITYTHTVATVFNNISLSDGAIYRIHNNSTASTRLTGFIHPRGNTNGRTIKFWIDGTSGSAFYFNQADTNSTAGNRLIFTTAGDSQAIYSNNSFYEFIYNSQANGGVGAWCCIRESP